MVDDSESIFGRSMLITGEVQCRGRLIVEGRLEGSLVAIDLQIKETGQLLGRVTAEKIECLGRIEGEVFTRSLGLGVSGCQVGMDIRSSLLCCSTVPSFLSIICLYPYL